MKAKHLSLCHALLLFTAVVSPISAEQSRTFGAYTVHYNAFTTNTLSPEMAKIYNIKRSKNRALLNVSILQEVMGTASKPVRAKVTITATNMNAQLRQLVVRELIEAGEPGAIYYLAETTVDNGEVLTYTVNFTPAGEELMHTFTFEQEFITE
jgi:hypothetical protein